MSAACLAQLPAPKMASGAMVAFASPVCNIVMVIQTAWMALMSPLLVVCQRRFLHFVIKYYYYVVVFYNILFLFLDGNQY